MGNPMPLDTEYDQDLPDLMAELERICASELVALDELRRNAMKSVKELLGYCTNKRYERLN